MQPSEQLPASMLQIGRILSITEPLGAIAMTFGFLTQIAAVGFSIIMVGAIASKRKTKTPFWAQDKTGWELDFIILAANIALFFLGAGQISIDRAVFRI